MTFLDTTNLEYVTLGALGLFFIAIAWLLAEFKGMKDEIKERLGINNETIKLRLQAYERLTLFAERVTLNNLITRLPSDGVSAHVMQLAMVESIKSEYDYNVSQQIYVGNDMWKAITKLRDQNIYIIYQVASTLPPNASAMDLNKHILEYSIVNKNAELSGIVLDALRYETKKLFK
ncbi:MAG: hypothetical protein ABJA78_11735 [Ferruginibacter sp.]